MKLIKEVEIEVEIEDNSPYDESLHGFLLRNQLLYSPSTKPVGVISQNGGWIKSPFVSQEAQHVFSLRPDHELLEIIDIKETIDGIGNQLFDCPIGYTHKISNVFFSNNNHTKINKNVEPIVFCEICIRESIEKFGYGYFKNIWSFYSYCAIHNEPLKQFPLKNFSSSLSWIADVMQGNIPDVAFVVQDFKKPVYLSWEDPISRFFFPIKASLCAFYFFAQWILNNEDLFDRGFYKLVSRRKMLKQCGFIVFKKHFTANAKDYLTKIYLILKGFNQDLLDKFFEQHVEIVKIQIGPRKQGVLQELITKIKGESCSLCNFKSCSLRGSKDLEIIENSDINIKYLMSHSYSLLRIVLQQDPLSPFGSDLWSPMELEVISKD
ncbi:MAG: hypothetical protein WBH20_00630 [Oceanisphaera sp.]|uniref:hypothetical protein n=1 Tax=Oceanisphaera sp. TaxID=1929979 RepID=UPI003C786352